MIKHDTRQLASDTKFYESYSRFLEEENRYETWHESVDRVCNMHRQKYAEIWNDELEQVLLYAKEHYYDKLILGAQRALQFGGDSLLKHEAKIYNCTSSHLDRVRFFSEYMYLLLCGAGVGFSIQRHHIAKLPKICQRSNRAVQFTIDDSIEGWADAIQVLMESFFEDENNTSKYFGKKVYFDFSKIRSKGSLISGGFKAPGPEPLRKCIAICEEILTRISYNTGVIKTIEAYDIAMHIADAVISGGVRRAATIALFSDDDEDMLGAKTGNWFVDNPQRARSNNSVILLRSETTLEKLNIIAEYIKQFGEPGFILADSKDFCFNPCVEIGMLPITEDGESGFQACNLTEINGSMCDSSDIFYKACEAASIIGTFQAGYTNFKYLSDATKKIVEREALLGVSITGWMNNPQVLFDENVLKKGALIVNETNKKVAKLLGINQAARTTCVKPSGNASVLLKTANGIHGEHAKYYIRHIQMNKESEIAKLIKKEIPEMLEESVWSSSKSDYCISFPFVCKDNNIFKNELLGIKQLEFVKKAQQFWVENGTNIEICRDPQLRHNVSNTITVDDWDSVIKYVYDNKQWFAGISFIPMTGDKDYAQAPNAAVLDEDDIIKKYGSGALFASGLICHGLDAFNDDLWLAISTSMGMGLDVSEENHNNSSKRDFVKRFKKFADAQFNGDLQMCAECLKDVHYLHKWEKVQRALERTGGSIDWALVSTQKEIDIDTMGAQACSGVKGCEI